MHSKGRSQSSIFGVSWSPANAALTIMFTLLFLILLFSVITFAAQSGQAQTFTVLHTFTGGDDGGTPYAGVTIGGSGTLYGTTYYGGMDGDGVVFELSCRASSWTLNPLHSFAGYPSDGSRPWAGVVIGPNGAIYGTTYGGGNANDGTVFELRPPPTACLTALCPWNETVLHSFQGWSDGAYPGYGNLIFDQAGNIYGTTSGGGQTFPELCLS